MVQEELVNVAVPRSRLGEVYALLGSPPAATGPAAPSERTEVGDGWTDEIVNRAYRESEAPMRLVFDHLAERAGEWVSAVELARLLNLTKPKVRGVLGALPPRYWSAFSC